MKISQFSCQSSVHSVELKNKLKEIFSTSSYSQADIGYSDENLHKLQSVELIRKERTIKTKLEDVTPKEPFLNTDNVEEGELVVKKEKKVKNYKAKKKTEKNLDPI